MRSVNSIFEITVIFEELVSMSLQVVLGFGLLNGILHENWTFYHCGPYQAQCCTPGVSADHTLSCCHAPSRFECCPVGSGGGEGVTRAMANSQSGRQLASHRTIGLTAHSHVTGDWQLWVTSAPSRDRSVGRVVSVSSRCPWEAGS